MYGYERHSEEGPLVPYLDDFGEEADELEARELEEEADELTRQWEAERAAWAHQVQERDKDELEALVGLVEELDLKELDLDELVNDLKLHEASDINNDGQYSQLVYILSTMGYEAARKAIRELAEWPDTEEE